MLPAKVPSMAALADIVPTYNNQLAIVNGHGIHYNDQTNGQWVAADNTALEG
jgi:hypothetical protein